MPGNSSIRTPQPDARQRAVTEHRPRRRQTRRHSTRSMRRNPGSRNSLVTSGDDGDDSDNDRRSGDPSDTENYPPPRSRTSRASLVGRAVLRNANDDDDDDAVEEAEEVLDDPEATLRERQEAMNTSHPFGLPVWKPALYKKSRSITRFANRALHAMPKSTTEVFLNPGNLAWAVLVGWWLALVTATVGIILYVVPPDGHRYGRVLLGLAGYLLWPFGRAVLRECQVCAIPEPSLPAATALDNGDQTAIQVADCCDPQGGDGADEANHDDDDDDDQRPLLSNHRHSNVPSAAPVLSRRSTAGGSIAPAPFTPGRVVYYALYYLLVAPLLLLVSLVCWFGVLSIPMAKLSYKLTRYLRRIPLQLRFRRSVPSCPPGEQKRQTVLLCTNAAAGLQYYKYTVDGVNIMFINLLGLVFFTLVDAHLIGPWTNHSTFLSNETLVFLLCLVSTIPLAYFIGQAVSSISAQSTLALGAVINATFGSIIEVILYIMALMQGKAALVEGSLIGSFLAGLLLMPGLSMITGGLKQKEMRFNARSAGVSSSLLIMSVIGAFAPTLFFQTYGSYEMACQTCPAGESGAAMSVSCSGCTYRQTHPIRDPFFLTYARPFTYVCAAILPTAYLIGLLFTLKTHTKHIYTHGAPERQSRFFHRALNLHILQSLLPGHRAGTPGKPGDHAGSPLAHTATGESEFFPAAGPAHPAGGSPSQGAASSSGGSAEPLTAYPTHDSHFSGSQAASAHPHHHILAAAAAAAAAKADPAAIAYSTSDEEEDAAASGGHGGHDAPNWSKTKSAVVLLACTVLFSAIAELLVDLVDTVVEGLSIGEKFVGMTIFALVPNVPEFTNAIAFSYQKNIALALEICSAYTVQVSLLQIPALVAFSAWWNGGIVGGSVPTDLVVQQAAVAGRGAMSLLVRGAQEVAHSVLGTLPPQVPVLTNLFTSASLAAEEALPDTSYFFTLVFPRFDVVAVAGSVYICSYALLESRANYFKGSILFLAYLVWLAAAYFEMGVHAPA
ncbi:hypothetical protein IWQ60_006730 [Tieghemiomyces parasiticus]|uniref:Calcium/proton exchanger n=1 Tax=Tieghemiomyces parasiticus TaxID=78921 RepID=A0A9W8DWV4_9FUNG|nr:hypothetical protein IWQ60_006730 [Tieghemiomyces parasiticus]